MAMNPWHMYSNEAKSPDDNNDDLKLKKPFAFRSLNKIH